MPGVAATGACSEATGACSEAGGVEEPNQGAKEGEVYDFAKKEKVKTQCVQIFSKAMDGPYGIFGNINPQKINTGVNEELPF